LSETVVEAFMIGAEATPAIPVLAEPQVDAQGTVTLTGTAEPGTTIEIVGDGSVVGTALVNNDGTWDFAYAADAGSHQLAARSQAAPDVSGAEVSVEVPASTPDGAPTVPGKNQEYIVQPGDSLNTLAERLYGDGQLWRLIFVATNERATEDPTFHVIENPNLIRPGWKLWIPAHED